MLVELNELEHTHIYKNGLSSVCPWAHAKRGNFRIWEILIGVVGVFAKGPPLSRDRNQSK